MAQDRAYLVDKNGFAENNLKTGKEWLTNPRKVSKINNVADANARAWRNWQTRWIQVPMPSGVGVQVSSPAPIAIMRQQLSGRVPPCQGGCREFESRLPLH